MGVPVRIDPSAIDARPVYDVLTPTPFRDLHQELIGAVKSWKTSHQLLNEVQIMKAYLEKEKIKDLEILELLCKEQLGAAHSRLFLGCKYWGEHPPSNLRRRHSSRRVPRIPRSPKNCFASAAGFRSETVHACTAVQEEKRFEVGKETRTGPSSQNSKVRETRRAVLPMEEDYLFGSRWDQNNRIRKYH